jgi:hypothetical protein
VEYLDYQHACLVAGVDWFMRNGYESQLAAAEQEQKDVWDALTIVRERNGLVIP